MQRFVRISLWAAISAAFVGPGTVATAGAAGARFGLSLTWVVVVSVLVCLVLQEASARLAALGGSPLPALLAERFGRAPALFASTAVVFGCAAFEAGNVLGAAAGLELVLALDRRLLAALVVLLAGLFLAAAEPSRVARRLALLVALMGLGFGLVALFLAPEPSALASGLVPRVPAGSETLLLGLLGTTVVPYNLYLGARLARGGSLSDARVGLLVSVPAGGLLTLAVVVVGSAVPAPFDYAGLAGALDQGGLPTARWLFAAGLFAAGLSSAITAPLAASAALEGLFPEGSRAPRLALVGVLATGGLFGLAGVTPLPVILLAQAANGLVLPLVAVLIVLALRDPRRPAARALRLAGDLAAGVALLLGLRGLSGAASAALGLEGPSLPLLLALALLAGSALAALGLRARRGAAE